MAIHSSVSPDGSTLNITVEGRFDASYLDDFRRCYEGGASEGVKKYVVDLSDTLHLDSSALGMLLVLRDYAGGDASDISICNCSDDVKKIFAISAFGQLFDIQ